MSVNVQPQSQTIEQRLAALEVKAKADVGSVEAWFKAQWPHAVTYAMVGYGLIKHIL